MMNLNEMGATTNKRGSPGSCIVSSNKIKTASPSHLQNEKEKAVSAQSPGEGGPTDCRGLFHHMTE